jgi:transcriptional regulator with XRE-family HTH domain
MSLGSRIRAARISRNLTQKELAAMVGVTGSAIGNYEKSVSSPNEDTLILLMSALKVDANYLYSDYMESNYTNEYVTPDELLILSAYRRMNSDGRNKLSEYARDLSENDRYRQDTQSSAI